MRLIGGRDPYALHMRKFLPLPSCNPYNIRYAKTSLGVCSAYAGFLLSLRVYSLRLKRCTLIARLRYFIFRRMRPPSILHYLPYSTYSNHPLAKNKPSMRNISDCTQHRQERLSLNARSGVADSLGTYVDTSVSQIRRIRTRRTVL